MNKLKNYFEKIISEGLDKNFLFVTKQKLNNFYFPFFIAQVVEKFKSSETPQEFSKFYMSEFAKDPFMRENYPEQGQSENTYRNTISAEFFGLIKRNNSQYKSAEPTDAYKCLKKYIKSEKDVKNKKALIDRQLEKLCLNVNANSDVYKNVEENSTFITMLFYKVLIMLKDRVGESKLSYNEFLLFLNRARSYGEFESIVDNIIEYRSCEDETVKKLADEILNDNSSKTVRYTQLLEKLHCIEYKNTIFAIKDTEYAERYIRATIELFEKSGYNQPKTKKELIEFLNSDNYFIGKLDAVAIIYSDEKIKESVDESSIEDIILEKYEEMDLSEMEQEMDTLYENFNEKFSPKALSIVPDEKLPRYMFYSETSNKENMCWNLEFNPKSKAYFGSISGGSAYLYGLHYSQKHKKWMTGTSMTQIEVNYEQAIEKAKEIRKLLSDAVNIVDEYKQPLTVENYAEMHNRLLDSCGEMVDKLWVKKYLHMMFPDKFSTFYNWKWLTFLNKKCKFEQHSDLYELSGELSMLASRVDLPNAIVSKVLFELFGYPADDVKEENVEEKEEKTMVVRTPRTNKIHPLNAIVYGAPGTAKTYSMKEYAVAIIDGRKVRHEQLTDEQRNELSNQYKKLVENGQIVFTTFHQSYGYEDFIQGLRPESNNGAMDFVPMDGVFKRIADKAMQDTTNNYVIIIDEINRGNISKVFGELITLIEDDKRWGEKEQLSVILPSGEEFAVPNNLYIVGTMNSADKSIALIDTALRRRFDFIEVAPNAELVADDTLRKVLEQLNAVLRKELDSSDLLIGHAYFIGKTAEELASIMNRNIIPLLYEYFYDNEKKVKDALVKALDGTEVKLKDNVQGRIRVE